MGNGGQCEELVIKSRGRGSQREIVRWTGRQRWKEGGKPANGKLKVEGVEPEPVNPRLLSASAKKAKRC